MKVTHLVGWYFPESSGGTEVYVEGLVKELTELGIQNVVAAPRDGTIEESYTHNGIKVYRYPVYLERNPKQIRGEVPHGGFEFFTNWLKKTNAKVCHQHSWTLGCGIHHLRAAKQLGMTTVLTIHTPASLCLRGTMMLYGNNPCDGRIEDLRCCSCWGAARGGNRVASELLARTPIQLSGEALDILGASSVTTAIGRRALAANHRARFQEMIHLSDRIVVVCDWLYQALLANNVPKEKLVMCRQGLLDPLAHKKVNKRIPQSDDLRICFLGRWDTVKGIHVLVDAVRRLPFSIPIKLEIYCLRPKAVEEKIYYEKVSDMISKDHRISLGPELSRDKAPIALAESDLLAVPSQWLETGPYVVLEAQAAGIPVLGSNLGGIAELIQHGVNGWLVSASDISAWSKAIAMLAEDRNKLEELCCEIRSVRSMGDVAKEMSHVYEEII